MIDDPSTAKKNPAIDSLVMLKEAAQFLKMSERSVGQKARDGIIPSVKIGGARRFSIARLQDWIEQEMCHGKHC